MRSLHLSDLHVAACALRVLPPEAQQDAIQSAIAAAQAADRYRKRLHKAHPEHGTGTIASVFGAIAEPAHCDAAYLAAMAIVVAALRDC